MNIKSRTASIYFLTAIFQATSTFSPAVGYIVGALFLSIYTDMKVKDEQT